MDKDIRKLLQALQQQGCTIEPRKNRHVMVRGPNGGLVTISTNTSDVRRMRNVRGYIRRELGLDNL